MQKLKITLFTDRRPGHEKQSRGIIDALSRYIDVALSIIAVERLHPAAYVASHLRYLCHIDRCPEQVIGSDLIIGTGSRTHIPVLSAARTSHAKAVTCMTPVGHLIKHFDLCFVPLHDKVKESTAIFRTIGPPNVAVSAGKHDANRGLILIGGIDEGSHVWSNERLVDDISKLLSEERQWTISTSPRTPADTEALIPGMIRERQNVSFLPFSVTPAGWIEEQYRCNASVWITADSVSMVYEALSAGCGVGILPVQWKKSDNKFKRSLDYLADRNLVIQFDAYQPGKNNPLSNNEPLNEADRCAKEILRRWWPKSIA